MIKVVIIQGNMPHYRISFFDSLAKKLNNQNMQLTLFYGKNIGEVGYYKWAKKIHFISKKMNVGELIVDLVILPGILLHLYKTQPDIVVMEDLGGLPNSLMAASYCRFMHKPYLIWGLGNVPGKKKSFYRKILKKTIKWFYEGASAFICYSNYAKEVYQPKRCFVAKNSCLPAPSFAEKDEIMLSILNKYSSPLLNIIYIGLLIEQKRVDTLLNALAKIKSFSFKLDIIGSGECESKLKKLALDLKISDHVIFHGAIYDKDKKKSILLDSHIGILPGRGGLAIQEIMWHGTPVISGLADGTEKDLISHEKNGYLLQDFPTEDELLEVLSSFQSLSTHDKQLMAQESLETIATSINIENMIAKYCEAIECTLNVA